MIIRILILAYTYKLKEYIINPDTTGILSGNGFLEKQSLLGWHFRLNKRFNSDGIRRKIRRLLDGMIKEMILKHFFVDRGTFDAVDKMIDYKFALEKG